MNPTLLGIGLIAGAGLTSLWLTGVVLQFARQRQILDLPTERSSHTNPTPRGGGLAIVIVVGLVLVVLAALGAVSTRLTVALAGGGALVAWIGWRDDRHHASPALRGAVQIVAAAWAVGWLDGYSRITLGGTPLWIGPAGSVLAVIGIVWSINLFNFMDGIDGIAGAEAFTVAGTGALLLHLGGGDGAALIVASIAAATLGFLRWNWMPARIFLGDIGSNFLGFAFGTLAVWSENYAGVPAMWWGIAALVFITDSTCTLMRRATRHERILQPHRSHAYQRLTQAGWSHAAVTRAVVLLNLVLSVLSIEGFLGHRKAWMVLILGLVLTSGAYLVVEWKRPMSSQPPKYRSP